VFMVTNEIVGHVAPGPIALVSTVSLMRP
jgi:hypothetical protein